MFKDLKEILVKTAKQIEPPVECIVGLDSRGFIFGPLISLELNIPFVPIRKKGKLPGDVLAVSYSLEYGQVRYFVQISSNINSLPTHYSVPIYINILLI